QLRVGRQPAPERREIGGDVLQPPADDEMAGRVDGGGAHFVAAAARGRQALGFHAAVGAKHDKRRRGIRVGVDRSGGGRRARGGEPEVDDVEAANEHVCLQRSSATANTMIAPVTICCTQFGSPCCEQPIWMMAMIAAPAIVPTTLPLPPRRLPPPMMTAAITWSSSPWATVGSPTDSFENAIRPARAASAPAIV